MLTHYLHLTLHSPRNEHPLPALISAVLMFGLVLFAILRGPKTRLTRLFCLNFIFNGLWAFGIYQLNVATNAEEGLFWVRLLNVCSVPIAPTLFHFMSEFTDTAKTRFNRSAILVAYLSCFLIMATGPFSIFIPGTVPAPGFFYYPRVGPTFGLELILFAILIPWAFSKLIRAAFNKNSPIRNKSRYALLGYFLAYAGGLQTFLPALGLPYWPYGLYFVPVGVAFIWYAVVVRELLAFGVIIRKTLVYSMVTALLTAIYVAIVFGLAVILQSRVSGAPAASSYAIAAIVITLLFHPLRMRIQRWVDRHFSQVFLDDRFVQELTSGFVHELKRPLATIVMPAELALMDIREILQGHKRADEVLPKTEQRLQHIVNAALDASHRIEAVRQLNSSQRQATESIALKEILLKSLELENPAIQEAGITVKCEIPDNLPRVAGHPNQLELVFMNLIRNAIEAMSPMDVRQLVINGDFGAKNVFIAIADSGPGIPSDQQARVFEPYFTTKDSRGMGMGLYLSQQVIKAHGGLIRVYNSSMGGAEFRVELPSVD